jgi:predicted deacylase
VAEALRINGQVIPANSSVNLELQLPALYTRTPMTMPIHVRRGKRPGPCLFVCAAVHGDELNGVEIIRRLMKRRAMTRIRGTVIAVPLVNVYGVIDRSRYLPDRRDLNRSFPGSGHGSLASRLADLFMTEIVAHCSHGIDLHTGAVHRGNLPQIRGNLDDEETLRLARLFGVPVLINADMRDGSLREAAAARGIPMLLYEAGEALRFDEVAIRAGVQGIVNIMRGLDMLPPVRGRTRTFREPFVARSSTWVRAPASGIFLGTVALGAHVKKDALLGTIAEPLGDTQIDVRASRGGIVIGRSSLPMVLEGEALFHIASFEDLRKVADHVEAFQTTHEEAIESDSQPSIV